MAFLNSLVQWLMKKRYHEIALFEKYPFEVQNELLFDLIISAENSQYGREYAFQNIFTYSQFQKEVPIVSYEDIEPYIERMRKGEKNVLWSSEVRWFAKSSGTVSSKSKFIPVSQESMNNCHYQGGKDVIALYHKNYENSRLWYGQGLAIGGSQSIKQYNNDLYYEGDLSAIFMDNLPFWAELYRTPSKEIALMSEWESKIEFISKEVLNKTITNLSGVPSWTILILEKVLEMAEKKRIKEVWPQLELYVHGGVSFTPYRERFQRLIGSEDMRYMEVYNASEGFFAIQDDKSRDDLLLMLDYGIFYEFIPMNDFFKDTKSAIPLEEVKMGVNYALVITTNGGLWRYIIGDTVMFTSTFPYRIKITGRTKAYINAVGEEVVVENADRAIAFAAQQTGASISEYTAAPRYLSEKKDAAHEWIVEFEKTPSDMNTFINILDSELKKMNSDYEAKRHKSLILHRPIVHLAPKGSFYNWLKMKNKLGGQHKVPRLSNNREVLEEMLEILNKD